MCEPTSPPGTATTRLIPEAGSNVPLTVGGFLRDGEVVGAIEIPGLASLLGTRSFDGELPGLDQIPADEIPPVNIVHTAFGVMVGLGTLLLGLAAVYGWVWWRHRRLPTGRWFYWAAAGSGIAAVVAMEAGWITTEVGRQPWVVWQQVRTADAVTNAGGVIWSLAAITVVYLALAVATILALRRMSSTFRGGGDVAIPYGPPMAPDDPARAPALVEHR